MAKLIYSMITSLDGYAEAAEGDLGTGAEDQDQQRGEHPLQYEALDA